MRSQLIDSLPDSFLTNPLFAIPTPCQLCRNYSTPYSLLDPQCTHRYTTAVLNVVDYRCISVYKICQTLFPSLYVGVPANSLLSYKNEERYSSQTTFIEKEASYFHISYAKEAMNFQIWETYGLLRSFAASIICICLFFQDPSISFNESAW